MDHGAARDGHAERALNRTIVLLALVAFTSTSTMRVADPMLPELARAYSTSLGEAARVVSWYAVVYGLMQLFMGTVGDRFGKLRVVALSACAASLGSLACALAGSLDQLVLARLFTAAAAAGIIPSGLAWIGDRVPFERRQITLARMATGTTLGLCGGQLLGGILVDTVGWRWAFALLAAGFCGGGLLVLRGALRQPPDTPRHGTGLIAPLRAVFATPWARRVYLLSCIEAAAVFAVLALLPTILYQSLGLSLAAAGSAVAAFGFGALLFTLVARRLIPALGEIGLTYGGAALFVVLLLPQMVLGSGWLVAALCLGAGFGWYMLHSTLQAHVSQVAPAARGTAMSMFAAVVFFGQAVGVALGAWVVGEFGPRVLVPGCALIFGVTGLVLGRDLRRRARGVT